MKLAVVVGGWHWPIQPFHHLALQASGADLFVVAHRNPELPIVREEKQEQLNTAYGPLADLDRALYFDWPTVSQLERMGWTYIEAPNTVGDWGFFNQWLDRHDYREYDVILNCHDDTLIRKPGIFEQLTGDWLLLANGKYPEAPDGYVRGSFEFWKRELIDHLGGRIDLGNLQLTREGKVDTPAGFNDLAAWNDTGVPLRDFMVRHGIADRIRYLSPYYRISPWVIEGERGLINSNVGAPWSFEAGLKAYPIEVAA